jgi:hypothetical protein
MTNLSKSFSGQANVVPHLAQSHGALKEIVDLRQDVEKAFIVMEAQDEAPYAAQANIRMNTQPTAADTITIGADIYEFKALLTDAVTTPGNIAVLRGASAPAALANIIAAINGTGKQTSVSASNGTVKVKASIYNTDFLHVEPSIDVPGGTVQLGVGPNIALSDGLTAAVNWDHTNLSKAGFDGSVRRAMVRITVDATNLANDFDVVLPFKPLKVSLFAITDNADAPSASKTVGTLTLVQARNAITVDLDGGATDPVATDIVYLEVWGK